MLSCVKIDNLNQIKEGLKQKETYNLAEIIVKYQKFKNTVILNKMNFSNKANSTKQQMIQCGLRYINTKLKDKKFSEKFYNAIQECIDKHVQPLVPNTEERRIYQNYIKKNQSSNINKVLEKIKKENITSKIEYGIKIEDKILLCIDEIEAKSFIKAIKFINSNCEAKIVTLEINDYKEGK